MTEVVAIDGVEYEVPPEVMQSIKKVIKDNGAKVRVNDVDADVYALLEELANTNWKELIPDEHTRALLNMAIFVDRYEIYEGASELSNVDITHFAQGLDLGGNSYRVLEVVNSGDF